MLSAFLARYYVPAEIANRLIAGENRVRVWREHRGLITAARANLEHFDDLLAAEPTRGEQIYDSNGRQCPSEITSATPSTTLIAVSSSIA